MHSAALMEASVSDNIPVTATWIGEGDRTNVNAPANWDCRNASGDRIDDVVPTADTDITISGATTFNVPAGQTLIYKTLTIGAVELAANCDWRGLGEGLVINGTINVKGYSLSVAALKGSGTITDTAEPTSQGACGELHVEVPPGTTNENTTVTLTGALKLVKDGAGTLKSTKAAQSYTGGTEITAGGITLGTNNGPVGQGNGSRTVSVAEGATFDFNGLMNRDSCRYHFVLDGGTVKLQGASTQQGYDATRASIASVTLHADSTFSGKFFYFGDATVQVPLTFNGHTLNLDVPSGEYVFLRSLKAEDAGTILANSGWFEFSNGSDLTKANVLLRNDAYMTILNSMVTVGGFAYERNFWGNRNVSPFLTVAGNYQVGANRPPFTLLSGATLDFKAWPKGQIWNPAGRDPTFNEEKYGTKYYSDSGHVTFAANGNFFVDVGERAFPRGTWTQLITWSAIPAGATFELPSESENVLQVADTGLYIKNAAEIDNNTPVTATWVGKGDRTNVNAPANWDCRNTLNERLNDAVPTADTAITISGATSFNVPAGQTLVYGTLTIGAVELAANCDWRGLGAGLVISGTVDVKGYSLSVAALKGSGTITDTAEPASQGACGELHVEVPAGTTLENTTVTLTGALKLVKDGAGTLKATKAAQSYTGGTEVAVGGITLGTNNGPVGQGNGSRTVSVAAGATFDFNGLMNRDSCRYHFVLDGGTVKLLKETSDNAWTSPMASIASVTLHADSTFSGKNFYFGDATVQVPLTFNGHTLNLDVPSGQYVFLRSLKAEDAGTILANSGWFEFSDGSDLTKANVLLRNDAYMTILNSMVTVGGFAYERNFWGNRNVSPFLAVAGNYQVGANRPPFKLLSGATLDFKAWPEGQIWNPAGRDPTLNPASGGTKYYSDSGHVTFADNGNFFVDVGERVFPPHVWTQLVAWSAKPTGAAFELPSESENELLVDNTGLYIREVSQIDNNTPVTATWVGKGDRTNVNAPANWDCRNTLNERLNDAVPTIDTAITISGATTFNVPAGQTLVYSALSIGDVELAANCDWRGLGAGLVINGTVDVKGYSLSVAALKGSGTITDTAAPNPQDEGDVSCGELHVEVPPGTTNENTTVTLTGALKLVKDGAGTLKATKTGQSYTGGTEVAAGGITLGTNTSPAGSGDGSCKVSVAAGATFDFGDQIRTEKAICRYQFVLDGGTVKLLGTGMQSGWTAACGPFASITLNADSTICGYYYYLGNATARLPVTFNGHTLTLDGNGGPQGTANYNYILADRLVAMDQGTLLLKGVWVAFNTQARHESDLSLANLVCREDGWIAADWATMPLVGFAYDWEKWHGRGVTTYITVSGNYQVGVNRPPFTLLSGATLDFKDWPAGQAWDPAGVPASLNTTDTYYTVPGLVTFAANGHFFVDVGEKRYTREPTKLVTWAAEPTGATFTLAPASKKMNNVLQVGNGGLYIFYAGGSTIFIR